MKRNKLSIILAILTLICIFSVAAIADQCGCRAIPVEEKVDVEEAEEATEEEVTPEEEEETIEEEELTEEETSEAEEEQETTESEEQAEAPAIELEIYEGPIYSSSDNVCYYRIKANVTGTPSPDVEFSKDDSNGAWGDLKVQINLGNPSDTYVLKANATNTEGTASDSIDLSWGCTSANNPPEITQIILPPVNLLVSGQYDISATAVDPDGDILTYSWSVSGGTIDDYTANPIVWTTPSSDGSYDITLIVDDGNGAIDAKTESVTVYPLPPAEQTTEVPIDGNGSIERDLVFFADILVGDGAHNRPIRGFVSFDIRDLAGTTINNVTLMFTNPYEWGYVYDHLIEAFWVKVVNWGDDPLGYGDFDLPSKLLGEYTNPNITIDNQALKDALQIAINNGSNRFQIMISHKGWQTNNNDHADYVKYTSNDIKLSVDYTGP